MDIEEVYKTRNGVVNLVEIAQGIMNTIPDADDKFMEPVVIFIDSQKSKIEELEKSLIEELHLTKELENKNIELVKSFESACLELRNCIDIKNKLEKENKELFLKVEEREQDIQKLVSRILGENNEDMAEYFPDYNNGDEWGCPFCFQRIADYLAQGKFNKMEQIPHNLQCEYLIAKDLKIKDIK